MKVTKVKAPGEVGGSMRRSSHRVALKVAAAAKRRENQRDFFQQCSFALLSETNQWITIAKAHLPDLPPGEINGNPTSFVRTRVVEKFGPLRTVRNPELVFEIAFDSVHRSTRASGGLRPPVTPDQSAMAPRDPQTDRRGQDRKCLARFANQF